MTKVDRVTGNAPAEVLRALRNTRQVVRITLSKFVGDIGQDAGLGFSAQIDDARGQELVTTLAMTRWVHDMEGWGATQWAWLMALVVAQASDVLPPFGGEEGSASISWQLSYKLAPGRWEALEAAIPAALREVLLDNRFRAEGCCLRHLIPPFPLRSMEVDAKGDPALVFDTGFMWCRASELLCGENPLEDRTHRPAVRYVLGGRGEAVLDGQGVWHNDLRAYIHARLQVNSPLALHARLPSTLRPAAHGSPPPEEVMRLPCLRRRRLPPCRKRSATTSRGSCGRWLRRSAWAPRT